ncbi:P2X purinoceptor 4 isoform X2 [Petaurus breviceps papuanus]|uniref:P2X purinoceptor 4 isoform X2 n=1 Tax=Petaurus breviceps papuanus TaxID=3040969 RepID=UPI0036DF84E6
MGVWTDALTRFFFHYDTPRIVLIHSSKVGLLNRAVQLLIFFYVIGWVFLWQKGYQAKDSVISSISTKVKGVALTDTPKLGLRIWDAADFVVPGQHEHSLFVMTNMITTLNQKQSHCAKFPEVDTLCTSDENCTRGAIHVHSHGVETGRCVYFKGAVKTCEVFAWCPVEDDSALPRPAFLKAAENFTLLIKNDIWYPKFNFTKKNILPDTNATYLRSCIYNIETDPFCPIFRLGEILRSAGQNFGKVAEEGGIMNILINWDCNLDLSTSYCLPKYSFLHLDHQTSDLHVSPGYNFRFAKYFEDTSGREVRTLIKAYGIRFDIIVFGKTTALCDIVVLYLMKKKLYYREKKYKYIQDSNQGLTLRNQQRS